MALASTQTLTEMSTRNLPGGKGRPARKAEITAICEPIVYKNGNIDVSQPYGPPRPVTGIALPFLHRITSKKIILLRFPLFYIGGGKLSLFHTSNVVRLIEAEAGLYSW
jgi:hypothetical protein